MLLLARWMINFRLRECIISVMVYSMAYSNNFKVTEHWDRLKTNTAVE